METDEEIIALLKKELTLCQAPLSGYLVACAVITEKNVYFNHNHEHSDTHVCEHAEERAVKILEAKEQDPKIKRVLLAGAGNVKKFKYYLPCFNCTQKLKKYADGSTEVYLLPLEGTCENFQTTIKELSDSYRKLSYSKIEAPTLEDFKNKLRSKTLLENIDLDIISEIAFIGKKNNARFYITGSSSGRGAVSNLIRAKTGRHYRDIDMIAVVHTNFPAIEKEVESVLLSHYKTYAKEKRPLLIHQSKPGVVFAKTFYYCGEKGERIIEFAWCHTFKDSFSYRAYQDRNWFHQLS